MIKRKKLDFCSIEKELDGGFKITRKGKNGEKEVEWISEKEYNKRTLDELSYPPPGSI